MTNKDDMFRDLIDEDLFEDLSDEEMAEILFNTEETEEGTTSPKTENRHQKLFINIIIWSIAITMFFSSAGIIFQTYSIPALDFIKASSRLSKDEQIKSYKEAVVTVVMDNSKGTGFSISEDGYIITNHHVINKNGPIKVVFPDGQRFHAEIISQDESIDLALLKVDAKDLPSLALARDPTYTQGEDLIFIGNPLSFHGIANEGSILDSVKLASWDKEVIMLQAPVYRGNSGSPVINEAGQVIGIIFATLKDDGYGKVGLFVPVNYYHEMTEENP